MIYLIGHGDDELWTFNASKFDEHLKNDSFDGLDTDDFWATYNELDIFLPPGRDAQCDAQTSTYFTQFNAIYQYDHDAQKMMLLNMSSNFDMTDNLMSTSGFRDSFGCLNGFEAPYHEDEPDNVGQFVMLTASPNGESTKRSWIYDIHNGALYDSQSHSGN